MNAMPADAIERVADQGCRVPPEGWWCSRARGHDGPCAPRPAGTISTIIDWYNTLPSNARGALSLHHLHKLSKALAANAPDAAKREDR